MATTQKQIAQHLGLSQALVGQALRGYPGVAETTRQRIKDTAHEMGYSVHDNMSARALIARRYGNRVKTGIIAVLMGDFMDGLPLQNMPFFNEILQGIHGEATQRGLDVAIHILRSGNLPRVVTSGDIDGAICIYSRSISNDLHTQEVKTPFVCLGHYQQGQTSIGPDDRRGIYETTQHLLKLGHRRIAYMGSWLASPGDSSQQLRFQGFLDALQEANIAPDSQLMDGHLTSPALTEGRERAHHLLAHAPKFSALVCANDAVALGAIEAIQMKGLRVPEDISVSGFDGTTTGYGGSSTLTTAFFDRCLMGRRAVEMLEEIARNPSVALQHEILPVRLLARDSTAVPALHFV